jgi:pyruvate-ferredoxin/flavodoxin oxidoreductase
MSAPQFATLDGNEAVALVAHTCNEVIAIYPITPASPMGEFADAWSAQGRPNLWGTVPAIVEMQSEGGAAGTIHGALQGGTLSTTFTASQGLLLMLPNMYKIAGELTPTVFHIAARSLAAQALSIFCDHSDVMSARGTGFAIVASNSVQEAHDMAAITQAATLTSRIPVLHFFDGFRTSHEVAKIRLIDDDHLRALLDADAIAAHRRRAMSPDHPVLRGTAQNPDVYFQARETVNPFYAAFPHHLQKAMDQFATLTGRQYQLYEYVGAPDAERVIVIMGSGAETVQETVDHLTAQGEKVGLLKVRLFRPFSARDFLPVIPATAKAIAVLDRTKEPGSAGEPLYQDVCTVLLESFNSGERSSLPRVIGGRFGLSSKEFTPAMVCAVFAELQKPAPKNHFTLGILDDVTHTSLDYDEQAQPTADPDCFEAVFYGLGADGTVSANKNSIKIIGEQTELHAQGYFVYDSKKSGAVTVSHLRFGKNPIHSAYLIGNDRARYIGCHQTLFLEKYDVLEKAAPGAVFLLNTSADRDTVWDTLPRTVQQAMLDKKIRFYIIDGYKVAQDNSMGRRINTIMQTCFFAISGVLPKDTAIAEIKKAVEKTYGKKGRLITQRNFEAIDSTLQALQQVPLPAQVSSQIALRGLNLTGASDFVRNVTAEIIAGRGDRIPVSQLPVDGTFPTGTAAIEKRNIALDIPVWDTELCTHCGKCAFVCPHSAIRSKLFPAELAANAPPTFKHVPVKGKDYSPGLHISYQVAPEDCTGCTLCVDICPIRDKSRANYKALNMAPQPPLREQERANWDFFAALPDYDRRDAKSSTMKGAMVLEPLFEFSGACSGCGETPYIRLASQLFGDRMVVANATGCSSIYGGNLPTTPWTKDADGRGPAWNNSLFEDNAEFGLGLRLAWDQRAAIARAYLKQLEAELGSATVHALLTAEQNDEAGIHEQRERIVAVKEKLASLQHPLAQPLLDVIDALSKKSVWIIGGDGWAYDIGFGGLDHVLASGKNVNILILDTEVYSNTGGQTSKATPRGAVAKFSAGGKPTAKKDLARIAISYENVYVAHVAYGAKDVHTLHTFMEAESYDGPSLIIAYSPCIAHGVDMANNHRQQNLAVDSGHWPLFRFDPRRAQEGKNPFKLDSKPPSIDYADFIKSETRFNMLWRSDPARADALLEQARNDIKERFAWYAHLAASGQETSHE